MPFSTSQQSDTCLVMTCMIMAAFLITDGFIWAACCHVMAPASNTNSTPLIVTVSSSSNKRSIISRMAFAASFISEIAGFLSAGRASTTTGPPEERPFSGSNSLRQPHTRGTRARRYTNTMIQPLQEANTISDCERPSRAH